MFCPMYTTFVTSINRFLTNAHDVATEKTSLGLYLANGQSHSIQLSQQDELQEAIQSARFSEIAQNVLIHDKKLQVGSLLRSVCS